MILKIVLVAVSLWLGTATSQSLRRTPSRGRHLQTRVVLPADLAQLQGPVVESGFGRQTYVDFVNASGDTITWNYNSASARTVTLEFTYALSNTARTMALEINNEGSRSITFPRMEIVDRILMN